MRPRRPNDSSSYLGETQRLPIIILTGSEDEQDELAMMEEGVDDYLRKPIDPARLKARCRAVLRRTSIA